MPKVLVLKAQERHCDVMIFGIFGPNFGQKRSHQVMDASCRLQTLPSCTMLHGSRENELENTHFFNSRSCALFPRRKFVYTIFCFISFVLSRAFSQCFREWHRGGGSFTWPSAPDPFVPIMLKSRFSEGDEDSNFSLFRVRRFSESPGPLH